MLMRSTSKQRASQKAKRSAGVQRSYDWPIVPTYGPDEQVCRLKRRYDREPRDESAQPEPPPQIPPEVDETQPVPPPPPARCSGSLYQVKAGDTLFRLSMAHGVSLDAIVAANPQISDPDSLVPGQIVCIPERLEDVMVILNTLLTAEKVETAMYAQGLRSPALQGLPPEQFAYFEAGLSHEAAHVEVLTDLGASVPYNEFFYPPGTFEDQSIFVNTLLTLETAGVSAYIQASDELARMGRFDLARLADQIMGVEAEHRALLREVLDLVPADNLCFERAPNQPVTEILAALPAFLSPNQFEGASEGPIALPTPEEVAELVGANGCPNPRPEL